MIPRFLGICLAGLLAHGTAFAETRVEAGDTLANLVTSATSGETLRLSGGVHTGAFEIDKPLTIECAPGAIIDGQGNGSVITVTSPDVVIRGCQIIGSGDRHDEIDSGVRLLKGADRTLVEGNTLTGNLYGVDVHGAKDAKVLGNTIIGRQGHRMNRRGNGVYVWNAPGSEVSDNDIRFGRDGIFTNTSSKNVFARNKIRDLRFAVHYMYTQNSVVMDNVSTGNHLGYAIMFSKGVRVENNVSYNDRDQGIMLNYANNSMVVGNYVSGAKERALFIYNSHKNAITENRFEKSALGIHFTAGSERNTVYRNAFVGNRQQVKYVGSKWVDWSVNEQGNYWSDHSAYDLNNDKIADSPYRPNDTMDRILWTQPSAKLLLGSPAVQLVRWAQKAFPATLPGGVIDRYPLMKPQKPKAMEKIQ
ncbi:Periplasmic copper-binding protein (NosD) [Pseudovibrio axinellae]|uniref:Periplasmic copper-binding protein (NosD) n=1 Tax=Pseudovibrio axinellae TaxID=989403 RepID=A0A165T1C6_9HYPH|nr:nitrous oxide reductase family maturation protein NosD [Pseudovibrio axinellae]KZL05161.1 Periplasmic copper-binding protein (NosD) [Pseudovibrio axinellae]SER50562.1 nitrous oxidase accessory protein [Pseudovibrio axinellae]